MSMNGGGSAGEVLTEGLLDGQVSDGK